MCTSNRTIPHSQQVPALPVSPETRLPETQGKFRRAVGRVDFERNQERQIVRSLLFIRVDRISKLFACRFVHVGRSSISAQVGGSQAHSRADSALRQGRYEGNVEKVQVTGRVYSQRAVCRL